MYRYSVGILVVIWFAPKRCSQDVLVVTAPGSGAEISPFLKTWVNLPMAIVFTIGYAKVCSAGQNWHAWCFPV